jgi:hypothetical protein
MRRLSRQAVLREQPLEERGVAMDILSGAKVQGQDLVGRIVDSAQEHQSGAALFEPGTGTAVDLDQRAPRGSGHAARRARDARRGWRGPAPAPGAGAGPTRGSAKRGRPEKADQGRLGQPGRFGILR